MRARNLPLFVPLNVEMLCIYCVFYVLFLIEMYFVLQASELRAYIKSKGAEISEENAEGGLHVDLAQIIEACDVCLRDDDKGRR